MRRALWRDALDGHDLAAVGLSTQHQARAHQRAVEIDRARSALALLACVLRAVKPKPLTQHVQEAFARPRVVRRVAPAVAGAGALPAGHSSLSSQASQPRA